MTSNPYFEPALSWEAARSLVMFPPFEPAHTAGLRLQSIQIHVRDHKMRVSCRSRIELWKRSTAASC